MALSFKSMKRSKKGGCNAFKDKCVCVVRGLKKDRMYKEKQLFGVLK